MENHSQFTAFTGSHKIASGTLADTLRAVKSLIRNPESTPVLIFDDSDGRQVDFNLEGSEADILSRLEAHPLFQPTQPDPGPRSPGRPKLGVTSREVTLLPRHWDWLEQQPQGSSAALRRLVEDARKRDPGQERQRRSRDASYRCMMSLAGDLPGFEEASRALFRGDKASFDRRLEGWPPDIAAHLQALAAQSWNGENL